MGLSKEKINFLGPDIKVIGDIILEPYKLYEANVQIPGDIAREFFNDLNPSYSLPTRSGSAQLGVEANPYNKPITDLINSLKPQHTGKTYSYHHPMQGRVDIITYSERPIAIPDETAVFRLINKRAPSLEGEELYKAVERGAIRMTGEEGRDWRWDFNNDSEKISELRGIIYRLNPEFRRRIPKKKNPEPILTPGVKNFRGYVDSFLRPIHQQRLPMLWIGETLSVLTLNGFHALIRPRVYMRDRELGKSYHINSLFLESERTDWPIRTEILGPTTKAKIGREIAMHFYTADRSTK